MFAGKVFVKSDPSHCHHRYRIGSDRRIVLLVCGFWNYKRKMRLRVPSIVSSLAPSIVYREWR